MYILSISKYRWRISRKGKVILSGIGTPDQALAVARSYGIVLSGFNQQTYLRAA
jgi:hypothetical protein